MGFRASRIGADVYLTFLAFVTGVALTAHTTWAIVNESMDHHEKDIAKETFNALIKVRGRCVLSTLIINNLMDETVALSQ
jgi:hypothetical protein